MRAESRHTRIASVGARDRPGYGFAFLAFEPTEVEQLVARRRNGATINDVLLGRLATTVNRWNDEHGAPTLLPIGVRRRLQDLLPLTGNVLVDTAVLSNLGRIESAPHLGKAGSVRELWFSPPGRMPLGASFGAATLNGRLLITLRYRHALLDATAAEQFLAAFKQTLIPAGSDQGG